MAALVTVIGWFRCPSRSTTSAVITFTMLPIGRRTFSFLLHSRMPVVESVSAASRARTSRG